MNVIDLTVNNGLQRGKKKKGAVIFEYSRSNSWAERAGEASMGGKRTENVKIWAANWDLLGENGPEKHIMENSDASKASDKPYWK